MKVAVHELKAGFSRYLAKARLGEAIEVTSHNKPVARLIGIAPVGPAGVARLVATGQAAWNGGKPALQPPLALGEAAPPLSEIVLQDRG